MVYQENNPPPLYVDVFNAFVQHVINPTLPDGADYVINCLQNYLINI